MTREMGRELELPKTCKTIIRRPVGYLLGRGAYPHGNDKVLGPLLESEDARNEDGAEVRHERLDYEDERNNRKIGKLLCGKLRG